MKFFINLGMAIVFLLLIGVLGFVLYKIGYASFIKEKFKINTITRCVLFHIIILSVSGIIHDKVSNIVYFNYFVYASYISMYFEIKDGA